MAFNYKNFTFLVLFFSIIIPSHVAKPHTSLISSPTDKRVVPSQSPSAEPPSIYASYPSQRDVSPNTELLTESPENFDVPNSRSLPSSVKFDMRLKKICDAIDYPHLCLSSVALILKGKADIPSVLQVTMKVGEKLSESALIHLQKMVKTPGASPELASILKECEDSYNTSLYNFKTALSAFPLRDIGTMNSMLSAVITDLSDCDDALKKFGEDLSLSRIAEKLANITSNCLAIISQLN